ncbi:MAG: CheR family methyltransferase [Pseudobdellovibrionaceae bacterium]
MSGNKVSADFDYNSIELSEKSFDLFANKMYEIAGVDLPYTPKNYALLRNRIIKILRRRNLATYEKYWNLIEEGSPEVIAEFISALTTNMTSFFREPAHFDFLKKILPEQFGKMPELRIWCCASSTGQEPYTIAMIVSESLPETQVARTKILATDIDQQVLKKASLGIYEEKDVQGLDPLLLQKFFNKIKGSERKITEERYQTKDEIHKLIHFAYFNLMNEQYIFQHKFQIIFCRNVLIYFDEPTTKRVIDNLTSALALGGYLILGHSESGNVKHPGLKPLSRAIYQKL